MNYYYLTPEKKPCGPLPLEGMCEMVERKQLSASVLVAREGDAEWRSLLTVAAEQGMELRLEGLPGNCPTCGNTLDLQPDGALPMACPHCGRAFRPRAGAENNLWYNFTLALRQYAKFSGRATRMEYWSFVLFSSIVGISLQLLLDLNVGIWSITGEDNTGAEVLFAIIAIVCILACFALLVPSYAVMARRLHDVGWSGKWIWGMLISMVLCYVAVVGAILMIAPEEEAEHIFTPGVIAWGVMAGVMYLVTLGIAILCLVLSFFDSERGSNKYGPSRKYPMG